MADSRKYSDSIFQKNDSRISSTDATAFSSIGQNAVFKDGQHNDPPMSEDVIMFDDTSTASANVDSSIVGVKRVSECSDNSSKSAAKKQKTRPIGIAKNFQGDKKKKDGAQARAMAYAQETNGVIFGRDHGNAKQYYVSPDKDHMYNFIFGFNKKKRVFYEWIPQNTPVRLYLDLEIERVKVDKKTNKELYRYESRDVLLTAINEAEKEVTRVVIEQLKEQHDVQVDVSQILSLNSDGIDKGSRHVIFPVWFDDNGTSMDSFVHSILGLLSTDVGQRATDKRVYSKHRVFRFFGNTKVGQSRWLHLPSQPDLKPFTPEHRAIFDASLVEAPPPDGVVPIHIEQAKVMNKTASTGIRAHFGGVSDTHPLLEKAMEKTAMKKTDKFKVKGLTECGEGIVCQAISAEWTCHNGYVHKSNNTVYCYPDRVSCPGCAKDEDRPSVCRYPPSTEELLVQNSEEIAERVRDFWEVQQVSVEVKGTTIWYIAGVDSTGKNRVSCYNQTNGRLQLMKAITKENVELNDARKLVLAHWKVETLVEKKVKAKITFIAGLDKESTYNKSTRRLVLQSNAEIIEPKYHDWEHGDFGAINKEIKTFVPSTVSIDGDNISCAGTFLPKLQMTSDRKFSKKGTKTGCALYIPNGSTIGLQACMGAGKTFTMQQLTKDAVAAGKRVLYITYRRSLASSITKDLVAAGISKVLHYRDGLYVQPGVHIDYERGMETGCNVMVCQLESISKAQTAKWDIIVTDEVQGLSAQFSSITFKKTGRKNLNAWGAWKILEKMYTRIPTAIFMDADLESWTTRAKWFIKKMRGSFAHIKHNGKPEQRKYVDCGDKASLLAKLVQALKAGLKVVVVSNSATFVEVAEGVAKKHTPNTVAFYGDKKLTAGMDINQLASTCDFMGISSGMIGSGVSIENKLMYPALSDGTQHPDFRPFDIVFAYGVATDGASPVREWNQALSRVRDVARGLYMYSIFDGFHDERRRAFSSAWDEVSAGNEQQALLFRNRRKALAAAIDERRTRSAQELAAAGLMEQQPALASLSTNDMIVRGFIPGKDFCYNLNLCEKEKIDSTLNFRSSFVQRAIEDGHRMYKLNNKKGFQKLVASPPDHLDEILQAIPEEYRQWDGWDASLAVKLKSKIVTYFNLDKNITQLNSMLKNDPTSSQLFKHMISLEQSEEAVSCWKRLDDNNNLLKVLAYMFYWFGKSEKTWNNFKLALEQWCEAYKKNENHNDLLRTFFEDKQTLRDVELYESYKFRFLTSDQLDQKWNYELRFGNVIGLAEPLLLELHQKFRKVLDFVFKDSFFSITRGVHKGKIAFYEPAKAEVERQLAEIDKLVPKLGVFGAGSNWAKKTNALLKWFENKGVRTCIKRQRVNNPAKRTKESCLLMDESVGLEYASMMGVHDDKSRNHVFDTLRRPTDAEVLRNTFNK